MAILFSHYCHLTFTLLLQFCEELGTWHLISPFWLNSKVRIISLSLWITHLVFSESILSHGFLWGADQNSRVCSLGKRDMKFFFLYNFRVFTVLLGLIYGPQVQSLSSLVVLWQDSQRTIIWGLHDPTPATGLSNPYLSCAFHRGPILLKLS